MKVWKNHAGYVKIRIMGKYPEKILNSLLEEGVGLRDVERRDGTVRFSLPSADFSRLRRLRRGSGCSVRIVSRSAPRRLGSRQNTVFLVSLAVFFMAALAASTRILSIEISSERVPKERVEAELVGLGVVRGARRDRNRLREIASSLMADQDTVNAKVSLHGVRLLVDVSAAEESVPDLSGEPYFGIAAAKDCVITSIAVTGGRALVESGRAVKEGELLVTGDLSNLKPGLVVPARAEVFGRVLYTVSASADAETSALVRSGREEVVISVCAFGRETGFSAPYPEYETETIASFTFDSGPFPVTVVKSRAYELVQSPVRDTETGTEKRARLEAQGKLSELIPAEAQINTVKTRIIKNGGRVTAVITATTTERIGIPIKEKWNKSDYSNQQ